MPNTRKPAWGARPGRVTAVACPRLAPQPRNSNAPMLKSRKALFEREDKPTQSSTQALDPHDVQHMQDQQDCFSQPYLPLPPSLPPTPTTPTPASQRPQPSNSITPVLTPKSTCTRATQTVPLPRHTPQEVLLFVPNLVGYVRLALLAAAACLHHAAAASPHTVLVLLVISLVLDAVDGALARALGQVSAFGAFLDVAIDIATRGLLWSWALPGGPGLAVVLLEALTFTCTHAASGAAWKERAASAPAAPAWVRGVMANGFRSPLGALAIGGLMGCPLWAWACSALPGTAWSHPALGRLLVPGRLLAAAVELWVVGQHMATLLGQDVQQQQQQA